MQTVGAKESALYLPKGQAVQAVPPAREAYVPKVQLVHTNDVGAPEIWLYRPAVQAVQAALVDADARVLYVPALQAVHAVLLAPANELYVPAGQPWHSTGVELVAYAYPVGP